MASRPTKSCVRGWAVDLASNLLQRCYGMPFVKRQHPNRMAVAQRTANGGLPPPCLGRTKRARSPEANGGPRS